MEVVQDGVLATNILIKLQDFSHMDFLTPYKLHNHIRPGTTEKWNYLV